MPSAVVVKGVSNGPGGPNSPATQFGREGIQLAGRNDAPATNNGHLIEARCPRRRKASRKVLENEEAEDAAAKADASKQRRTKKRTSKSAAPKKSGSGE